MMQNYIKKIPIEFRNAIKALCDEKRQAILVYLLEEGAKSFIEITNELEISKSNLDHHLKVLMRYGLIYNYYSKDKFSDKYSYYEISKLGNRIINNLINSVLSIGEFNPLQILRRRQHFVPFSLNDIDFESAPLEFFESPPPITWIIIDERLEKKSDTSDIKYNNPYDISLREKNDLYNIIGGIEDEFVRRA